MTRMPSLFVSHGSPMFAIEPGVIGPKLAEFGRALDEVKAIVIVSPHWQTTGRVRVSATATPETIHDLGGFPEALYRLHYPAPGAPALAASIVDRLNAAGIPAMADPGRGLDHGAWVPMRYLRPQADLPVVQVSMPLDLDTTRALQLGKALASLRDEGVWVIGSGSLTHNLHEVFRGVTDTEYAGEFVEWIASKVAANDVEALVDYRRQAPHAARAHPTEEHFLPLLVAMGAGDGAGRRIEGGMTYGTLNMDAYAWGAAA